MSVHLSKLLLIVLRPLLPPLPRGTRPTGRVARQGAVEHHEQRVGLALALQRPLAAARVAVLAVDVADAHGAALARRVARALAVAPHELRVVGALAPLGPEVAQLVVVHATCKRGVFAQEKHGFCY